MDDAEALALVMKASRSFEGYSISKFKMHRETSEGAHQAVDVEVFDAGPESSHRFSVLARSDDGRVATRNPEGNLETAIALVHWGKLG